MGAPAAGPPAAKEDDLSNSIMSKMG